MKNKNLFKIILGVLLGITIVSFITYKTLLLNRYKIEKREFNSSEFFEKEINIKFDDSIISEKRMNNENMSFNNYFEEYEISNINADKNISLYVLKQEDGSSNALFVEKSSITKIIDGIKAEDPIKVSNINEKEITISNKEIIDELNKLSDNYDFWNYIKDNYNKNNNIFTPVKKIKFDFVMNSIASESDIDNIELLTGDINGYIANYLSDRDDGSKRIHRDIYINNNNELYIIGLSANEGNEIVSDEFIKELLSSIRFD